MNCSSHSVNYIINTDGVPSGQPLQLNANNQLDAAQLAMALCNRQMA
jgi:hypothetical protein